MRPEEELVRKVTREFHSQKLSTEKLRTVSLQCGHRVQLLTPGDQYIRCPAAGCGKQYLYVHSLVSGREKLYEK